jgi:hypothetical protein
VFDKKTTIQAAKVLLALRYQGKDEAAKIDAKTEGFEKFLKNPLWHPETDGLSSVLAKLLAIRAEGGTREGGACMALHCLQELEKLFETAQTKAPL